MNAQSIVSTSLTSRASDWAFAIGSRLLYVDPVRRWLVRFADARLRAGLGTAPRLPSGEHKIGREHKLIALAVLHTVDRLIERGALAPRVARVIAKLWGQALTFAFTSASPPAVQRFRAEHGYDPPWFVTISPDHGCNLRCQSCYANSTPGSAAQSARLAWPTLDRIMTEARELWGVGLFVFSGGEPLMYRSQGQDLLDAAERHDDCLYLMFTNGTLIDRETATRLARLGNLTPAISVEGMRGRTDARRGAGVFDRTLQAMAHLREAGVPFGISVTVTRDNATEVLSDEFLDFFFEGQGAFYGFLFHHMPIGRSPGEGLGRVPTPEQRMQLWRRTWDVIQTKRIFLFDFWNSGPLVQGCVSAGRERGYVYIDWDGKVMPCVFAPYAVADIHQVYAQGGTLNEVWEAPFFRTIRQWQRDYGYGQEGHPTEGNWLRPCPIRDHYALFRQWVDRHQPEPEDAAARAALTDEVYYQRMVAYGRELEPLSREVWEREYICEETASVRPP
jgi:MoaA/NifB/PqqE/SkfB family radical SAM enzyme